jgi:hypothetical protein
MASFLLNSETKAGGFTTCLRRAYGRQAKTPACAEPTAGSPAFAEPSAGGPAGTEPFAVAKALADKSAGGPGAEVV